MKVLKLTIDFVGHLRKCFYFSHFNVYGFEYGFFFYPYYKIMRNSLKKKSFLGHFISHFFIYWEYGFFFYPYYKIELNFPSYPKAKNPNNQTTMSCSTCESTHNVLYSTKLGHYLCENCWTPQAGQVACVETEYEVEVDENGVVISMTEVPTTLADKTKQKGGDKTK